MDYIIRKLLIQKNPLIFQDRCVIQYQRINWKSCQTDKVSHLVRYTDLDALLIMAISPMKRLLQDNTDVSYHIVLVTHMEAAEPISEHLLCLEYTDKHFYLYGHKENK